VIEGCVKKHCHGSMGKVTVKRTTETLSRSFMLSSHRAWPSSISVLPPHHLLCPLHHCHRGILLSSTLLFFTHSLTFYFSFLPTYTSLSFLRFTHINPCTLPLCNGSHSRQCCLHRRRSSHLHAPRDSH